MKDVNAYLVFDGNCRQAMNFYEKCLSAKAFFMPFSETPCQAPSEAKDRIAHAHLAKGSAVLMASDTMPGMPYHAGNNFHVALACESAEEIETLFQAFSENGKVHLPLHDAFWGARFGMLTDQFGINWMFSYDRHKQKDVAGN